MLARVRFPHSTRPLGMMDATRALLLPLAPGHELRLYRGRDPADSVSFALASGDAEVCGAPLLRRQKNVLHPGMSVAVWTCGGCSLEVWCVLPASLEVWCGDAQVLLPPLQPPLLQPPLLQPPLLQPPPRSSRPYDALLSDLLVQRDASAKYCLPPPACMVVGPSNSGRSSLCLTLANLGARTGRPAILVDLDVGERGAHPPGAHPPPRGGTAGVHPPPRGGTASGRGLMLAC